jgi:hypothetical protein
VPHDVRTAEIAIMVDFGSLLLPGWDAIERALAIDVCRATPSSDWRGLAGRHDMTGRREREMSNRFDQEAVKTAAIGALCGNGADLQQYIRLRLRNRAPLRRRRNARDPALVGPSHVMTLRTRRAESSGSSILERSMRL